MTEDTTGRLDRLEGRVAVLETAKAVEQVHYENLNSRLVGIEDTLKWLVRLIISGFIGAAIAFIVRGGLTFG